MDDYKLHPRDNDFINSLYNLNNNNTNLAPIYNSLYNIIKKHSAKSLLDLLLNILNKIDDNICLNILKNIIRHFRYDNYIFYNIEFKLIVNEDIANLINKSNILTTYIDDKTLSYYEILTYAQIKLIRDISDIISLDHINYMTNEYINQLHNIEYSDLIIIETKIKFPIYHINYINKRDDFDFNNSNYHILYLNILRHINKFISANINKDIIILFFSSIHHTASWISNIIKLWINMENEVIPLDEENYIEYQNDIILFVSISNHLNLDAYFKYDYPDELIECFSIFQSNFHKLIAEKSLLNIHTKSKIIELNHNNNAWYDKDNMNELFKFYITLEKYNNSTGFDTRDRIRFFICKIVVSAITDYEHIIKIVANNKLLVYNFVILLLNDSYKNIDFFKNYATYYDETKVTLIDTIQLEFHSISMLLINRIIPLLYNYLSEKWLNYIIYEFELWWNSIVSLFIDEDVQYMISDIINTNDDLLITTKKNIEDFLKSFVYTSNKLWNDPIIFNKWKQYYSNNKSNIELFNDFIKLEIDDDSYATFLNKIDILNDISLNNIDIPDDFIDPLICELIEEPIVLPICNIIIDEKVIFKHILLKGDNPFNRVPLTIDELIRYQENENIKEMLKSWNDKYNEWKNKDD
jgi:hypothetical protein